MLSETEPTYAQRSPGKEEIAVGIDWIKTVEANNGRKFDGAFFARNVVCKLRDQTTLEFLKIQFGLRVPTQSADT